MQWPDYAIVFLGLGLRLLAARVGHNYDMDSFWIVANILDRGGNVYAQTPRYNYGPVWFTILHAINQLAKIFPSQHTRIFRYGIAGGLSLVDVAIFRTLWRRCGRLAAYAFLLNPISIIITGYHGQFDNLALLLGLWAVTLLGDDLDTPLTRRKLWGLIVLGGSLMTKHILFALPLWLAIKQRGWLDKVVVLALPVAVFGAGFLPFWANSQGGIVHNVLLYKSYDNSYFFDAFVPGFVAKLLTAKHVWLLLLVAFAVVMRRRSVWESFLVYTAVLVAASPAITNQYLAIPVPFTAVYFNVVSCIYAAAGALHLLVDYDALNLMGLRELDLGERAMSYSFLVWTLCAGVVWAVWGEALRRVARKLVGADRAQA